VILRSERLSIGGSHLAMGGDVTDLLSVVDDVGSPVYVYDLAEIRTNQQRLRAALPAGAELYYPLTANPHPELLREIRAGGALPAVCSPGELDSALVAGWQAREVLYTGRARRDADVDWALWLGVRNFTVDSPAGLEQLSRRAVVHRGVVRCLLRVSSAAAVGADPDRVLAEPDRFANHADRANARVVGLRVTAPDESEVDSAVELTRNLALALVSQGVRVEEVHVGGFAPRFVELLGQQRVTLEVDRDLVGTAGTLVTAVLDVRQAGDRQVVVLESGVNHLGVGACEPPAPKLISRPAEGELVETLLVGPTETPLDGWAPGPLPRLREGDLMAVPNVGACGLTAGLVAFAATSMPVEVVVDRDDPDATIAHVSRLAVTRYPENS
jgi:diaminopimelate decarboxylase